MKISPAVLRPRLGSIVVFKDVLGVRHDLETLDPQRRSFVTHPLMGKDAGLQFHPIVVRLEVTAIVEKLVLSVPIKRELDPRGETSVAPRIVRARPIDIDLQRMRVERHLLFLSPKTKGDGSLSRPLDLDLTATLYVKR